MKPRETVKLFTNKRNVPRPSKDFFNFYIYKQNLNL